MNRILNYILEQRSGNYCNVLELGSVYELQSAIEEIYSEFEEDYYKEEIIDFIESITIYYYKEEEEEESKEEEEELYNFNVTNYINELI
jgi:hypothetical protein